MTDTALDQLLAQRRSVRAYLPTPVTAQEVTAILTAARQAPSGANLQPGGFVALTGAPFAALKAALADGIAQDRPTVSEYDYFPDPMPAVLKDRQRAAGFGLYAALGIDRRDVAGRRAQFAKNYAFFDAPMGIVVTIDRAMGKGCWMDMGMALMTLFLAAEARGLATTGIGALAHYADLVHDVLGLPDDQMVVCGIALGHADPDAPVNDFRTERATFDAYAQLRGFDT
jgi:nitroreductase